MHLRLRVLLAPSPGRSKRVRLSLVRVLGPMIVSAALPVGDGCALLFVGHPEKGHLVAIGEPHGVDCDRASDCTHIVPRQHIDTSNPLDPRGLLGTIPAAESIFQSPIA